MQAAGSGQLEVTWTGNPAGNGGCTNVPWPDIETIDVLGLTGIDTASVSLMVRCFAVISVLLVTGATVACCQLLAAG